MNKEEIDSLINELKAQGMDEEKILEALFDGFKKGEYDRKDLEALANALGYELSEEFKNDETPDPITSKDVDIEDLKEFDPEEETEEEFEEKVEEAEEEIDGDDDDEEKEWDEAQKLFKI